MGNPISDIISYVGGNVPSFVGNKITRAIFGSSALDPVTGTAYDLATNKAGKEAERIAADQLSQQKKLEQEFQERARNEESNAAITAAGKGARERQRKTALANAGRGSTILTSPLGLTGEPDVARKSLLGQ